MTTWNASAGSPPWPRGSVSGPIRSRNSRTEPGQPCVRTSGKASGSGERTCRKWISCPSITVVNCATSFICQMLPPRTSFPPREPASNGPDNARKTSGWTRPKITENGSRSTGRSSRVMTIQVSRSRCRTACRDGRGLVISGGARRRRDQGGEHAHRGRLAGAVGTEHGHQLAGGDIEIDAPDRVHGLGAAHHEVLGERSGVNHNFSSWLRTSAAVTSSRWRSYRLGIPGPFHRACGGGQVTMSPVVDDECHQSPADPRYRGTGWHRERA